MVDVLNTLKSLFIAEWNPSNTDNLTPNFEMITDVQTLSMADGDYILFYELNENVNPFGIGGVDWAHERVASVDIRTTYKRAEIRDIRSHLIKMKDEVFRILKSKVVDPDGDHHQALIVRRRDLSDKRKGFGRMVVDTSLKYWGA